MLQSMGLQRVGHALATELKQYHVKETQEPVLIDSARNVTGLWSTRKITAMT